MLQRVRRSSRAVNRAGYVAATAVVVVGTVLGARGPVALSLSASASGNIAAPAASSGRGPVKTIAYGGVVVDVPASLPVHDLSTHPTLCVRHDIGAVYLGHQGADPACPARAVGKVLTVHLEPLDSSSGALVRSATTSTTMNGTAVSVDPSADVSHTLVAVSQSSKVVLSVTFGNDSAPAKAVLASLRVGTSGVAPVSDVQNLDSNLVLAQRVTTANAAAGAPYTGRAFDACSAPSVATMSGWLQSPYRSVGVYIGGPNRACPDGNLSASWVSQVTAMGWSLIPTYVGLQAPCSGIGATINPAIAYQQGQQNADDAMNRARGFGMPPGTPIFDDMEHYPNCGVPVATFISGWNAEIRAHGYTAGVYTNGDKAGDLMGSTASEPDAIWVAEYDGQLNTSSAYLPANMWANHQRIKQYVGGHNETYGGATVDIDSDYADYLPMGGPPPPPPTARPAARASNPSVVAWGPNRLDSFQLSTHSSLLHTFWTGTTWGTEDLGGSLNGNPAAISWGPNRLDIFARGTNDHLWHIAWIGQSWIGWEDRGGQLNGDPSVASWATNRLDVFARGVDNSLLHTWWDGTAWAGWESLGGALADDPSPTSWGANRLDIFARGTDNHLWHIAWLGQSWTGWKDRGGVLNGDPAAVSWGPNRLDIFARGTDNAMWHTWWDGSAWSGWETKGGVLTGDPTAVSWSPGRLDVFVPGAGRALYHIVYDAGAWTGFESLGGVIPGQIAAASWAQGRLDVLCIGTDGGLWHIAYAPGWTAWESLPNGPPPPPPLAAAGARVAAVSWGSSRVDSFVRLTDNTIAHSFWTGGAWASDNLGGSFQGNPAAVSWGPNRIDLFARGLDNHLWHRAWLGQSWTGWEDRGGVLTSDPAVTSWGPGRIDVFVKGLGDQLYHEFWSGQAWSSWEAVGGVFAGNPAVVSWGANRLDLFARGVDNHLWHRAWLGQSWIGWEDRGGVLNGDPAVASWSANRLDVFARGTDNALWHTWWDGAAWSGWESKGGVLTGDPTVTSWGANRLDVFVSSTGQALWHLAWDVGAWSGWEPHQAVLGGAPVAVSSAAGRLDILAAGPDGHVYDLAWANQWSPWKVVF